MNRAREDRDERDAPGERCREGQDGARGEPAPPFTKTIQSTGPPALPSGPPALPSGPRALASGPRSLASGPRSLASGPLDRRPYPSRIGMRTPRSSATSIARS